MDIQAWINDLKGEDSIRQASYLSGYAQTTLQRQLEKGQLTPQMVIALCRAYNRSPAQGLIETGYLYTHEVGESSVVEALRLATNQQLLAEIDRRLDSAEARYLFTAENDPTVVDIKETAANDHDGTVLDFQSLYGDYGYAADSSVNEQEAREERNESIFD